MSLEQRLIAMLAAQFETTRRCLFDAYMPSRLALFFSLRISKKSHFCAPDFIIFNASYQSYSNIEPLQSTATLPLIKFHQCNILLNF